LLKNQVFLISQTVSRLHSSVLMTPSIIHIPYGQSQRCLKINNIQGYYFNALTSIKHIIDPFQTSKSIQIKFATIINFAILSWCLRFDNRLRRGAVTSFRIECMLPIKIFHMTIRHMLRKSWITTTLFPVTIPLKKDYQ